MQVSLGIATLLYYVPTHLAACHQAGALSLLTVGVWLTNELRKPLVPKWDLFKPQTAAEASYREFGLHLFVPKYSVPCYAAEI